MLKIDKYLNVRVGDTAPDFIATALDGRQIRLDDLRGKVVLLDFWATWCAPCLAEMPNLKRAVDRYGKDGQFIVIGISLDSDAEFVRRFVQQRGIGWAQIVLGPAELNPVAKKYNVLGVPATFLIGPDGKVVAKDLRGLRLDAELTKLLPAAVARREPTDSGS
jgi:peroxiredoxin